jgi:hypothetical protein
VVDAVVDLHIHTTCSDGRETPEVVVYRAARAGLKAIAITDHDTVAGTVRAIAAAHDGTAVLSGVELSAADGTAAIHILGYGIDPFDETFATILQRMPRDRHVRAVEMVERLRAMDIPLAFSSVESVAAGAPITRAHVAEALTRDQLVSSYTEAFVRYLSDSQPAFVLQESLNVAEAIDAIHRAGGVAFMAHPGVTRHDEIIPAMARAGLDGIEAYHPNHEPVMERFYKNLARKYGLLISGGSDSHGPVRGSDRMGSPTVPVDVFHAILAAIDSSTRARLAELGSKSHDGAIPAADAPASTPDSLAG